MKSNLNRFVTLVLLLFAVSDCSTPNKMPNNQTDLVFPSEKNLKNIRQLTETGINSTARWSFNGRWITFQHEGRGLLSEIPNCNPIYPIYKIRDDGSQLQPLSDAPELKVGRSSYPFFLPHDQKVLFSTTSILSPKCSPKVDSKHRDLWPAYNSYQIYTVFPDGSDPLPLEPGAPRAYNSEATTCHDGSVVFTSDRTRDFNLYRAHLDSFGSFTQVQQITEATGYNGGATFSPDCKKMVWHASRPRPGTELAHYQSLLSQHWIDPNPLEIWIANSDGTQAQPITQFGGSSFGPTFTPDGNRILFASNLRDPKSKKFELYLIRTDGTALQQITYSNGLNQSPMFSPNGQRLVFSSNRNAKQSEDMNIFVADWVE